MEASGLVGGRPRTGFARWAALSGAVYVLLFVVGTIVLFSGAPDSDASPAKVIAWYSDSSHRDQVNAGWILIGLSIFFFFWFLAAVRRSVSAGDRGGLLTSVVGIGGTVYAALALAAVAVNQGIRTMSDDTFQHRVYPDLIHAANDVGYVMHATGAAGLSAMIIAMSYAFMSRGTWPSWAGWLGIVVGVLTLAAILFFTQWVMLLWILVVSVLMFLRPAKYEPVSTM